MKIIVSLTSYPARIQYVDRVIKTLLIQNKLPDKILLWLAEEQFPEKESDLPESLLKMRDYGMEIRWCSDLKSHKKYFFAMQEFPDDIIITIDDDVYYSPRLVEALMHSYEKNPKAISCTVANRIRIKEDNSFCDYESWPHNDKLFIGVPQMDIMAVGIGGVLYPPGILPKQTFDQDKIVSLCLNQDDLWLKAMEIKAGIPVVVAEDNLLFPESIVEAQSVGLFWSVNRSENDKALKRISDYFDETEGENRFLEKRIVESSGDNAGASEGSSANMYNNILFDMLKDGFYVFGAGAGAEMVTECLLKINENLKPNAYIVTTTGKNEKMKFGRPVVEIADIEKDLKKYPIIVSTAERKHKEIEAVLDRYKTGKRLFIKDAIMGKILWGKYDINLSQQMFAYSLIGKV